MNHPALLFRALSSVWRADPSAHRVEVLAADLVAHLARHNGPQCVALVSIETAEKLAGLSYLLEEYGFILRSDDREQGDAAFVYLHRADEGARWQREWSNLERRLVPPKAA